MELLSKTKLLDNAITVSQINVNVFFIDEMAFENAHISFLKFIPTFILKSFNEKIKILFVINEFVF